MQSSPVHPGEAALLVEYQAAQDSAQHHDNQVWTTTGIIWGAGLVLLGFVIENSNVPSLRYSILAVCVLAILLLIYLWVMSLQFSSIRNQKYRRCKEIESILLLEQHTKLHYAGRYGRILYGIVMTIFILTWGIVFITTLIS